MFIAAAALALTPAAAAAKKPENAPQRAAKVERKAKKAKPGSAQQRCRDERKALGPADFAAKYGKPRTKGSAKAKAKAARAAGTRPSSASWLPTGRCATAAWRGRARRAWVSEKPP